MTASDQFTAQRRGVFRGGSGSPLVLLHAGGASWRMWMPVLSRLVAERDVLAPTLLGNLGGPPLAPDRPFTLDALVDAVEAELDAAGFDRVDIVGNSLGGFVAFELARRGRARRLVAIGPMGMQSPEKADRLVAALVRGHRIATLARPLVLPALALPLVRRKVLWAAFGVVHGERVPVALARHLFHAITSCDVPAAFAATDDTDLQIRDVASIGVPTLLVHGLKDPIATRDQIARYLAELPDAQLVELPDAGHCPQLELPYRVAEEILRFTRERA